MFGRRVRRGRSGRGGGPDKCICPNCGYEEIHVSGQPCSSKKCPGCGSRMIGVW